MRKAHFYLTRNAAITMRDIYADSMKQWGQKTADKYMTEIYAAMTKVAVKPDLGKIRAHRAIPFLMVSAGKHFIVYDRLKHGMAILALLHQRRDIERVIADMTPAFLAEIEALQRGLTSVE